jgi:hypothetical protein
MGRRPTPFQQPRCTKKKGARADRCHILRAPALAANEVHRLDIGEGFYNACATSDANQVERRTAFKGTGGHDAKTAVARNRLHGLRHNVGFRFRKLGRIGDRWGRCKPAQDFKRAGEVELCDSREDHKADVELGHPHSPVRDRIMVRLSAAHEAATQMIDTSVARAQHQDPCPR